MSSYTTNYSLEKYEGSDKPNLTDQYNAAMDKIDAALKGQDSRITTLEGQGGSSVPTNHASTNTTYGAGTGTLYGHVKLSDSTSDSSTASSGVAATPAAVNSVYQLASSASATASQPATTSSAGRVTLSDNPSDTSSTTKAITPNAAYQMIRSYGGGGSTGGGVTSVNASNGIIGQVSGSTLTISGANASPASHGVVTTSSTYTSNISSDASDVAFTQSGAYNMYQDLVTQIGSGGGSQPSGDYVTKVTAGSGILVSPSSGTGSITVTARAASQSQTGIVQLASSGATGTKAATDSWVNTVQNLANGIKTQIHQSVSGSGSNIQTMNGDVFIWPQLGLGVAMLYIQTSSDIQGTRNFTYNYTVPSAYRPPQQAQSMRAYNHISGGTVYAQVRTDGSIRWDFQQDSGNYTGFIGATVVVWGFEI